MQFLRNVNWNAVGLAASYVVIGTAIGIFIPYNELRMYLHGTSREMGSTADEDHADEHEHEGHDHEAAEGELFDITLAAQQTLGLERGTPELSDFVQHISLPAMVRERPAVSNLHASSKIDGIVRKIYVSEGQSVREGDPLVELELTGESLASSQSVLLDSLNQLEIATSNLERLAPIANQGGVPRKDWIEQRNEQKRLRSIVESKRQELLVQGFDPVDIDRIEKDGKLLRTITIRVPEGIRPESMNDPARELRQQMAIGTQSDNSIGTDDVSPIDDDLNPLAVSSTSKDPWVYSIEKLYVYPGTMTTAGEALCDLAFHETLLLEGQAFERDLPTLTRLMQSGEGVRVQMGSDESPVFYDDIPIIYLDNHIDPESQVVRFYMELVNDVSAETKNQSGALFRSWKFRPAQRGHVLLPEKSWKNNFVLPAEAVASDGLDRIVFELSKVHRPKNEPAHCEVQPIRVAVLYEDRRHVVVRSDGELTADTEIAMNNAYMLLLQMNSAAGGGGHTHDHEH